MVRAAVGTDALRPERASERCWHSRRLAHSAEASFPEPLAIDQRRRPAGDVSNWRPPAGAPGRRSLTSSEVAPRSRRRTEAALHAGRPSVADRRRGGSRRRLPILGARHASWSPAGTKVAVRTSRGVCSAINANPTTTSGSSSRKPRHAQPSCRPVRTPARLSASAVGATLSAGICRSRGRQQPVGADRRGRAPEWSPAGHRITYDAPRNDIVGSRSTRSTLTATADLPLHAVEPGQVARGGRESPDGTVAPCSARHTACGSATPVAIRSLITVASTTPPRSHATQPTHQPRAPAITPAAPARLRSVPRVPAIARARVRTARCAAARLRVMRTAAQPSDAPAVGTPDATEKPQARGASRPPHLRVAEPRRAPEADSHRRDGPSRCRIASERLTDRRERHT